MTVSQEQGTAIVYRSQSLEVTLSNAKAALSIIGQFDLCDISDRARLDLPIWHVQQQNVSEPIWGYGAALDKCHAQVCAVMEAIEHASAERLPPTIITATCTELYQSGKVLDPRTLARQVVGFTADHPLRWLPGVDLRTKERIWVPADYVLLLPPTLATPLFPMRISNGLAAGNTLTEAIAAGLCEVIERDAWTLAWIRMALLPHMRDLAQELVPSNTVRSLLDPLHAVIEPSSMPSSAHSLCLRFMQAGLRVVVFNITADTNMPVLLATGTDDQGDVYYGAGAHPDTESALIRALTECAQSWRVGVLKRVAQPRDRRMRNDIMIDGAQQVDFRGLAGQHYASIEAWIESMLAQLAGVGLNQAIAVDLTHPDIAISVVRIIVPGAEDWYAYGFAPQHCRLGQRGQRLIAVA